MTKKASKSKPIAFADAIGTLVPGGKPSDAALRAFSDLSGEQLTQWRAAFAMLPAEQRVALMERIRDMAEEDIEVDFRALFRAGLSDGAERVRLTSIEGLEEEDHPSLIDDLITLLRDDPSDTVRAAAAQALGMFVYIAELDRLNSARREQLYSALMRALLTTPSESLVHRRALESLAFVTNEEVDLQIREAYASTNDLLRLSAIVAMGRSQNRAYQETVRGELRSISPAVRRDAAFASGQLEDEDAVKDLAELLDDPVMDVRFAALDALAAIGTKDARALVVTATESEDEDLAEYAEEALEVLDFEHGDIDFSMALFDEDEQKPSKIVKSKANGLGDVDAGE
jgi:HEAT repeat protein